MTTATVQEGPETSFCLATDAACTDDCPCRPCRLRMETMNSSSTTSSTTDTEFGQASHDGWTSHESYAKRWPALERKRRKSREKYMKGDTALNDLNFAMHAISNGWQSILESVYPIIAGAQARDDPPASDQFDPASPSKSQSFIFPNAPPNTRRPERDESNSRF